MAGQGEHRAEEAETARVLLDLAHELARVTDRTEIAERLAAAVPRLLDLDASAVLLLDPERRVARMVGAAGWPTHLDEAIRAVEVPYEAAPLLGQRPVVVERGSGDAVVEALLEQFETQSAMVAPIVAHGEAFGLVAGVRRAGRTEPIDDHLAERLQGLADQAATAFQNAQLVEALQEQRGLMAHLIESGPIVAFRGTTDGFRITYVSGNTGRLYGYAPDEVMDLDWREIVHPSDLEITMLQAQQILVRDDVQFETRLKDGNGEYRWVWVHLRGESRPEGHRDILGYLWDRTAQRDLEERYRVVSELTSDFAYVYDVSPDGRITPAWASGAHEQITGYTMAEMGGSWASIIHPDDQPAFVHSIEDLLKGDTQEHEFRLMHKSGEIRWARLVAQPEFDARGMVVRIYGAATDVTERKRAEEALRQREADLREAQRLAALGSWRLDLRTGELDLSDELARVLGIEAGPSLTMEWGRVHVHPDDRDRVFQNMVNEEGVVEGDVEYRFIRPDGEVRWVFTRTAPELDEAGNIVAYRGITQDVTDRRRAEELHRAITDAVSDAAFSYSVSDGRMVLDWVTDPWERLTGYEVGEPPPAELFRPIIHPDDIRLMEESEREVLLGRSIVTEFRVVAREGDLRWLRIYAAPVRDDRTGEVVKVYGAAQDVTERHAAEQALRESEDRFRLLVEQSPLAIVAYSPDGTILMWNPAAESLFGWKADEVVGLRPPTIPEEEQADAVALSERIAAGERVTGIEGRRLRKDGTLIDVELSAAPVAFPGLERPAIIAMIADVSERRKLENELLQAQKLQAIGQLAGGVAHDFNNLLTAILGHAEFLLDDPIVEEDVRENAEAILATGEQAASLTRQLLLVSRHEAPDAVLLDLDQLVRSMVPVLTGLTGEAVTVHLDLRASPAVVRAARPQMEQMILNLVVNARDAMPEGGRVTISTAVEPGEAGDDDGWVVLAVADTGHGMDQETLERAFDPFFTTKAPGRGTGLGLSVVHGMVTANGGTITLTSRPGEGTDAVARFPLVEGGEADPVPDTGVPATAATGVETVLVVEDEPEVRRMASRALEKAGYCVLEAADGEEALTLARRHATAIHLVVSDLVMPRLGGADLAAALGEERPEARILFVSGYTDEAPDVPGASYLQKPFTPARLLHAVRTVLDGTTEPA